MDRYDTLVCELVREHAWLSDRSAPVAMHNSLTDLGLDSMTVIQLAMSLELQLGFTLPDSMFTAEVFECPASLAAAVRALHGSAA
jgi:acyl carrier protein